MGDYTDLIRRLEELEEGDAHWSDVVHEAAFGFRPAQVVPLTTSIDAALTLVPAGAWAEGVLGPRGYMEIHTNTVYDAIGAGKAATPALALCIAALKARARQQESGK